jgi:hypothetical protein
LPDVNLNLAATRISVAQIAFKNSFRSNRYRTDNAALIGTIVSTRVVNGWKSVYPTHDKGEDGTMKTRVHLRQAIAAVICSMLIVSPAVRADDLVRSSGNAHHGPAILDVRLTEIGVLLGALTDGAGRAIPNQSVALRSGSNVVAQTQSDRQGRFALRPPQPGSYQLQAGNTARVLRIWTAAAAPPAAQSHVLLVDDTVVRGQHGHGHRGGQPGVGGGLYDGGIMQVLSNPWVFSGVVAAGIAIPIAIAASDDDDDAPGS